MMEISPYIKSQDSELTSLNWLNKPDVLNSLCAPLSVTNVPNHAADSRRQESEKKNGKEVYSKPGILSSYRDTDKVLDVILNVRFPRHGMLESNKPQLSFACMIFMSIESSVAKMLPVREIYSWIMSKFPFYKSAPSGWRNSIRLTCSQATSQVVSSIDEAPPSGPLIDHGYFSSFQSTHVPTTASAHNSTRGGTIPSVQLTTARSGQASLVQPQSNTSNTATVPTQPTTTLTICNQGSLIVTNEHLKQLALNKRGGTSNLLSVQGQVCSNLNQSVQLQPIQAAGPPTNSEASAGAEKMSGLSELVSLDVMLQEGCLTPGEDCLSLTLMGVTFTAGLLRNGSLSTPSGEVYKVLLQWANACWEKLGHKGKKMKRQQAYKNIYYDKEPLLHYCQRYNKKRVKSYLDQVQTSSSSAFQPQQQPQEHNQGSLPQLNSLCASHLPSSSSSTAVPKRHKDHSCDPLKTKTTSTPQSVAQILSSCKVFSVSERELCGEECLPEGFWISDGGIKHWPADLLAALEWD